MPLKTFQITADIPEGYEPTGEFRTPKEGEYSISTGGCRHGVHKWSEDGNSGPRVILRKAWHPPKCFPNGAWVYKGYKSFDWFVVQGFKPREIGNSGRYQGNGTGVEADRLAALFGETFTPPEHTNCIQVKHD